ncbi:hypothetical protein BS50DRAFT_628346 [Corynespora cassiicola Philippines]|uniref:Uncharacterized protein n=1 Tax=Corynespora cassiicola Philippines TaxID=1448308 RepID=A0A2T2PBT2_CORCC|nr:hypothetical protein BS50DRAFT_628346 [Corynespora cassiicola Philippines]
MKTAILLLPVATLFSLSSGAKLYVCTSKDLTGECTNLDAPVGQCIDIPLNDALSSIKMNSFSCDFFTDKGCTGTSVTFNSDQNNLRDGTWNDQLTSVKC